jgi:Skp family chaperone for outer membrane proteins
MTKTLIPALILGAAATASLAQEAAKPEAKSPRFAMIDMGEVSNKSLIGKGYAAQLETLRNEIEAEATKKQNDLTKLDAAIKALQDELEKQGSVLSPEARDRKQQEIVRKTRERQAYLEDGQAELQRMRERAQQQSQALNNEFQQKIKPIIDAVAKDKGLDVIFDSQVAITVSKAFDISQDVIVKADDLERSKPKAAAKPAADKPAPKPSPTPQP